MRISMSATAPQAVAKAIASLVTSTIGRTVTPSGPTTIVATGRDIEKPPPPPPAPLPLPPPGCPGPAATADVSSASLGPEPAPPPKPKPPPAVISLAVITVWSPARTGSPKTAPGRAAEKIFSTYCCANSWPRSRAETSPVVSTIALAPYSLAAGDQGADQGGKGEAVERRLGDPGRVADRQLLGRAVALDPHGQRSVPEQPAERQSHDQRARPPDQPEPSGR